MITYREIEIQITEFFKDPTYENFLSLPRQIKRNLIYYIAGKNTDIFIGIEKTDKGLHKRILTSIKIIEEKNLLTLFWFEYNKSN